MKRILFSLLLLALPLAAQNEKPMTTVAPWLAELSNLKADVRKEYIQNFTQAKQAMAAANWVTCDTCLNTCELIFDKNPNVWNIRCLSYIEQKRLNEAEAELKKAQKVIPDDPTTLINMASLYMARHQYRECIEKMNAIVDRVRLTTTAEVVDIITFRIFLCYLLLGEEDAATDLVADYGPLSDSPIYYYSRAAICLYKKDYRGAQEDMAAADRIFSNNGATIPYQRAIISSGLAEAKL